MKILVKFQKKCRDVVRIYRPLLIHWIKMVLGRSYWHADQGLGRQFSPGTLDGYFNDMTSKTKWHGETLDRAVPLSDISGTKVAFPTTVIQKGLGHWDMHLLGHEKVIHMNYFISICDWVLEHQKEDGGLSIWSLLGTSHPSDYSAMTQGEAISLLVRGYKHTNNPQYLRAARLAINPLFLDISQGGVNRPSDFGPVLEELPSQSKSAILNGWIFAIFGLYDYLLLEQDEAVEKLLNDTLNAFVANLDGYNLGFWSAYDLTGNIASPFYHKLHVSQIRAMEMVFTDYEAQLSQTRKIFERQSASKLLKYLAIARKAVQKIKNPPSTVIS